MVGSAHGEGSIRSRLGTYAGLVVGLAITAASMSSGFIWASEGKVLLVYACGFTAWSGYVLAHYATEGVFVDDMRDAADPSEQGSDDDADGALAFLGSILPEGRDAVGFLAGIAILVAGIAILAWFVRQGNHLLGNVGSGMFLGGYVIAHYFDAGKFL